MLRGTSASARNAPFASVGHTGHEEDSRLETPSVAGDLAAVVSKEDRISVLTALSEA